MNILIPMAGRGSRFTNSEFVMPKPLININGKSMIELVIDNLRLDQNDHFIFIVRQEHVEDHQIDLVLKTIAPNCEVLTIDYVTDGAACTCLLAEKLINNDDELLIANCDQLMVWNKHNFNTIRNNSIQDGILFIFDSTKPNNSYAKINNEYRITFTIEKKIISRHASCGVHYWKCGSDFVISANKMIDANDKQNGEFYVCPTYNYLIEQGKVILPFFTNKHYPIGTPEDLNEYLKRES